MSGSARQCARNPRCLKGEGHAGWCKTKQSDGPQDQDSLFAALSSSASEKRRLSSRGGSLGKQSKVAAMQELARKRNRGGGRRQLEEEEDDDDSEDDDDGDEDWGASRRSSRGGVDDGAGDDGVEYADYGMSRAERKAMRERGVADAGDEDDGEGADGSGGAVDSLTWRREAGEPDAPLADIETIRLRRQVLEKWLLEPFFARVVRGCVIRIGLQNQQHAAGEPPLTGPGSTLYRAAEVVGVEEFPEHPYMLGSRRTCKRLHLHFGESKQWYPMSSVSNQPLDQLELRSWQQVLEVARHPRISASQLRAKQAELQEASHYEYSEADVTKRINEERKQQAQAGKQAPLTTRQKLLAQHGSSGAPSDLVARPMKFQRNVLGQAIVAEHE